MKKKWRYWFPKLSASTKVDNESSGDRKSNGVAHQNGRAGAAAGKSSATAATAYRSSSGPLIQQQQHQSLQAKPLELQSSLNGQPTSFSDPLVSLKDVPSSDRQALLVRKLKLCSITFDFTDSSKNPKEKEMKRQTLLELVDYISSGTTGKLNEVVSEEVVKMVTANIHRSLPPSARDLSGSSESLEQEEEEPIMDPAWPHLQLVYEFLLRYVVSTDTDAKIAKRYVDHAFVLRLLDLFDSDDPRERDYLKTILHRIYGKFMVHRPFIRKAINNIFYRFIFETERHNGIAELLEILGSIINGFALPLKEEHKLFLVRALIPLHKPRFVSQYHQQLSYCITQFVEKDLKLADTVIRGLLKYWPVVNSQKEVLFLGEMEEILEGTQAAEFQRCMVPLFRQLARCLNSSHFQVAERALFLWNNDHIVNLVAQNRQVILPLVFSSLEKNSRSHWNQTVHNLTLNVRKMLVEMDPELFSECQKRFEEEEAKHKVVEDKREAKWRRLEAAAAARSGSTGENLLASASASPCNGVSFASGKQQGSHQ
ncbi:hypothetical protein SELMODRAFT_167051 [Selaginella moellendorffii]|uniref:Serine/threonine protein phosphatase 2A regulatory subunit n=1 Tax=Selaginella moellendorffii TaxID=88036 RepID=D8R1F8_SELML|nr:serine/threonine protein phosphatase 2A 57 kDa regulatory subunit B' beta isoform [Selaginella moellendorffii]EFJ33884.1 hypothetical protein SELMODRAFT_167051 [Selaginella moellendorffii]|eukprot:XP_002965046.1 serine/threonine protein phosphatase 2A 57 kDa regulatory subunit B' beta isoform [Selaginella moellendorffii]